MAAQVIIGGPGTAPPPPAAAPPAVRYRVTAALAICYVQDQGQVYVYQGGIVPVGTTAEHIKHLLEVHVIEPIR